jgi:CheY-like chemotaxis protein
VRPRKILLADDSITTRRVVELSFADEGFEVFSVADGDAAMTKFVEIQPDIVIADVNMPGMNGYRICEMIKADETTRNIPVFLLVGSFEPFDPGEASRVGANYYFTKPFRSIRELVDKVTEYLELDMSYEPAGPETADIEELYNESIHDASDGPQPDPDEAATAENDVDTAAQNDRPRDAADQGVSQEPEDEFELLQPDEEVPTAEPAAEIEPIKSREVLPPRTETLSPIGYFPKLPVTVRPELGDPGMDDEIIETSHPGEQAAAADAPFSSDPFDHPVEDGEATVELEKDASMAKFDWSGEKAGAAEKIGEPERVGSPLKFTIEDVEPMLPAAAEEVHFAPRDEPEAARGQATHSAVSPELIEIIVRSVLEKMSDQAVREVAGEAVPRIAEKLIREALDEEKKG